MERWQINKFPRIPTLIRECDRFYGPFENLYHKWDTQYDARVLYHLATNRLPHAKDIEHFYYVNNNKDTLLSDRPATMLDAQNILKGFVRENLFMFYKHS